MAGIGSYIDLGNPVSDHPLNRGLLAWWLPLPNNAGGVKLFDLRNVYTGTLEGRPTWTSGDRPEFPALSFDGSDDNIAISNLITGSSFLPRTITAVIRSTSAIGAKCIVGFRATGSGSQRMELLTNSGNVEAKQGGGGSTGTATKAGVTAETWQMVTAVFASSASRTAYLNGVPGTAETTSATPSSGWDNWKIGSTADGSPSSFATGRIGAVWVYDWAMSDSAVQGLYRQWRLGYPDTLRRWDRKSYAFSGGTPPPTSNRRRRVILCASR